MKKKAKKSVPRSNRQLPMVQIAVLCERVIKDTDNVATIVRIVDTFTLTGDQQDIGPGLISCVGYIVLKSGKALGKRTVQLVAESPTGDRFPLHKGPVEFRGGEHGAAIQIAMNIVVESEGLFWIDVIIGKQTLTRMPLKVRYRQRKPD